MTKVEFAEATKWTERLREIQNLAKDIRGNTGRFRLSADCANAAFCRYDGDTWPEFSTDILNALNARERECERVLKGLGITDV